MSPDLPDLPDLPPGTILTPEHFIGPPLPVFHQHTSLVLRQDKSTTPGATLVDGLEYDIDRNTKLGRLSTVRWEIREEIPNVPNDFLSRCSSTNKGVRPTAKDLATEACIPKYKAIATYAFQMRGRLPFGWKGPTGTQEAGNRPSLWAYISNPNSTSGSTNTPAYDETRDAKILETLVLVMAQTAMCGMNTEKSIQGCYGAWGYVKAGIESTCNSNYFNEKDYRNIVKRAKYLFHLALGHGASEYPSEADSGIFCSIIVVYVWQSALVAFFGKSTDEIGQKERRSDKQRREFIYDVMPVTGQYCAPRVLRAILKKNVSFWQSPQYKLQGCPLNSQPKKSIPKPDLKTGLLVALSGEEPFPAEESHRPEVTALGRGVKPLATLALGVAAVGGATRAAGGVAGWAKNDYLGHASMQSAGADHVKGLFENLESLSYFRVKLPATQRSIDEKKEEIRSEFRNNPGLSQHFKTEIDRYLKDGLHEKQYMNVNSYVNALSLRPLTSVLTGGPTSDLEHAD